MASISLKDLPKELAKISREHPMKARAALYETALHMQGVSIPSAINSAQPYPPVDKGQYRAAFEAKPTRRGAIVGNVAKHSLWIEVGRRPGPVPLRVIREWALRKGIISNRGVYQAARAIARKIASRGVPAKYILRNATLASLAWLKARLRNL